MRLNVYCYTLLFVYFSKLAVKLQLHYWEKVTNSSIELNVAVNLSDNLFDIIMQNYLDLKPSCSKCCKTIVKSGYISMKNQNKVKSIRESRLMSKSELARKSGVSALTIDRVERGEICRMETMRKIILALGYSLEEKNKVFQDQA